MESNSAETRPQASPSRARKPYEAPEVIVMGPVATVTMGSFSGGTDVAGDSN